EVGPPEVVGEDEHDVRRAAGLGLALRRGGGSMDARGGRPGEGDQGAGERHQDGESGHVRPPRGRGSPHMITPPAGRMFRFPFAARADTVNHWNPLPSRGAAVYLKLLKRVLFETDKRLPWKLAYNMGFKGALSVHRHKLRLRRGQVFPPFLYVSVINSCNLRCQGCWVDVSHKQQTISPAAFHQLVREAKGM